MSDAPAAAAADFEKLGAFYLGRPYDPAAGKAGEGPLLYDSRDLFGMPEPTPPVSSPT